MPIVSNANLTGASLSGDLTNANLANANLTGANLSGNTLTNANFAGATVLAANLGYTTLTSSQLYSTASYQAANLAGIGLSNNESGGLELRRTEHGWGQPFCRDADQCQSD